MIIILYIEEEILKICTKCGNGKPLSEFGSDKRRKDGLRIWCKTCTRKDNLDRYHRQDDEKRARHRWAARKSQIRKYGISVERYEEMWREQGGRCKICGDNIESHSPERHKVACIDHCHTTGAVRGLLCWHCNVGLGKFFDDVNRLSSAIEYLKEFK